jgi:hypothetical protein
LHIPAQAWQTKPEVSSMTKNEPNKSYKNDAGKNGNTGAKAGQKAQDAAAEFTDAFSLNRDPYGSYTGHPKDNGGLEQPVQDADDL